MIQPKDKIEQIRTRLAEYEVYIAASGKSGDFDIHKYAEDFVKEILNLLYGFKLINANLDSGINFPVLDLIEKESNRCFQVTSNKTSTEWKRLVTRFESKYANTGTELNIFILSGTLDKTATKRALTSINLANDRFYDFERITNDIEALPESENYRIDAIIDLLERNHLNHAYLQEVVQNYKISASILFSSRNEKTIQFIEPYLGESYIQSVGADMWDGDQLMNLRINHEYIKTALTDVYCNNKQFVITGHPGEGKSELMRHVFSCLNSNDKRFSVDETTIPLYVDLADKIAPVNIETLIQLKLKDNIPDKYTSFNPSFYAILFQVLSKRGKLCLLFDSYDELDSKDMSLWNEKIKIFQIHNPQVRIIIAARKNRIGNDIHLPINKVFQILPFDEVQLNSFVKGILKSKESTENTLTAEQIISKLKFAKAFYSAPTLILEMLTNSIIRGNDDLTSVKSKSSIYQEYFEFIISKKLEEKGIVNPKNKLGSLFENLLEKSFEILSCLATENYITDKKNKQNLYNEHRIILEAIEKKISSGYLFQKDILFFEREVQLLKLDSQGLAHFNHYTYQEYFFSRWLKKNMHKSQTNIERWFKSAYLAPKYHQVFLFLIAQMTNVEVDEFLTKIEKWPLHLRLLGTKTIDEIVHSKTYFIGELMAESNVSKERLNHTIKEILRTIEVGYDFNFKKGCKILGKLDPGNEDIENRILELVLVNHTYIKQTGIVDYVLHSSKVSERFVNKIIDMLDHQYNFIRSTALETITALQVFEPRVIAKVTELHFLEDSERRTDALDYFRNLSKVNVSLCTDFIAKWEKSAVEYKKEKLQDTYLLFVKYYVAVIFKFPGYDANTYELEITEILKDPNTKPEVKSYLINALRKTGARTEKTVDILVGLMDGQSEISSSILMLFRDLFIVRDDIIQKAIQYIDSDDNYIKVRAINYLETIRYDGYYGSKRLADRIRKVIDEETVDNRTVTYAIDYMGKIIHEDDALNDFLLEKLAIVNNDGSIVSRDTIIRYMMNQKHYSDRFFKSMVYNQTIRGELDFISFISDEYFENIEKYVPEKNIEDVRSKLAKLLFTNVITSFKFRKYFSFSDEDTWSKIQIKKLHRTMLAYQRLTLTRDEKKWLAKIKMPVSA